ELAALLGDLAEEAGILDGEGGLRRKGLEQLDDVGGELARSLPKDGEPADQVVLAHEGHRGQRAIPGTYQAVANRNLFAQGAKVGQLDRLAHLRETSGRALSFPNGRRHERLHDVVLETLGGPGL